MTYIALKRMLVKTNQGKYEWREPGDLVPEVQSWNKYDIEIYIEQKKIKEVKEELKLTKESETLSKQINDLFSNPLKRYK